MKKADVEKLIGTDHEVRIQAPNSMWPHDAKFGQVIATNKAQSKSAGHHVASSLYGKIRDPRGNEHGGVHVRYKRTRWFGDRNEVETVDEVVPYSHIHAETRAEHEARVAREREEREAVRREEERVRDERRERAKSIQAAFRTSGLSVHDNYNGTVSMSLDTAEQILQRLEGESS